MLGRVPVSVVFVFAASCALPVPKHAALGPPPPGPRDSFVVLGDTQRSLWSEEHFAGREQNEKERVELVDQLARDENPAFVVHLGDLVAKSTPPHWRYFEQLTAPLTQRDVPILPVLGNHEYFGEGRSALAFARRRYPELARGGYYAKRWGRLGLVWLDTNLTGHAARGQARWLKDVLGVLDATPAVAATLVFTHHPPYTNGVKRHGLASVRDDILLPLRGSRTALALLSAHVHGYERFTDEGIALIVSGGGGGARVEYRTGAARSRAPAPDAPDSPPARPFNYLVVRDTGTKLSIVARCLVGSCGCPRTGELDRVELTVPRPPR